MRELTRENQQKNYAILTKKINSLRLFTNKHVQHEMLFFCLWFMPCFKMGYFVLDVDEVVSCNSSAWTHCPHFSSSLTYFNSPRWRWCLVSAKFAVTFVLVVILWLLSANILCRVIHSTQFQSSWLLFPQVSFPRRFKKSDVLLIDWQHEEDL